MEKIPFRKVLRAAHINPIPEEPNPFYIVVLEQRPDKSYVLLYYSGHWLQTLHSLRNYILEEPSELELLLLVPEGWEKRVTSNKVESGQ